MTLSVLETSLPMQRSHDTLAFGIWTKNWCLESIWMQNASLVNRVRELTSAVTHPRLRLSRSLETYECCHHPYQPQPGNSIKISSGRASILRLWQCQPALNYAPCKLQRQIGRKTLSHLLVLPSVQSAWHCLFWRLVCQCREVMTP